MSLDEVNRWIDEHNGKIKIIGFYGSLQYTMLIAAMAKFKYSTLTIKYYPDVEGYEYKIYLLIYNRVVDKSFIYGYI